MRKETAFVLYTIALSLLTLMILNHINIFRYIYPNYVGLLFVFGLSYTLTRKKAYDIVLMVIGGMNFITAIIRFALSGFSEAAEIIYPPMLIFSALFLILFTTLSLIIDHLNSEKEKQKTHTNNLDVYQDKPTAKKRKHF